MSPEEISLVCELREGALHVLQLALIRLTQGVGTTNGEATARELRRLNAYIEEVAALDTADKIRQQVNGVQFRRVWRKRFPKLTPADLRLMSLIRYGFRNEQAAAFLGITEAGILKGRHRLRQHLGLGPNQSLESFIQSL